MSNFCFVILDSIIRAPYIENYLSCVKEPYDIIIWDRSNTGNTCGARNFYALKECPVKKNGAIGKAVNYLKFSAFANKLLSENDYKGVFVFSANTAWLIKKSLLKKYKNRYLLDIRDYWQENRSWFYAIEEQIVNASYANVISSNAFRTFLPAAEYTLCHNLQIVDGSPEPHEAPPPLVISCVGGVKYLDYDKKVIDYFANDGRFFLRFIGRGYEALAEYVTARNYTNVYTEGMFPANQTVEKYNGTDMILNMYGNNTPKLDYALSNKLYLSARFNLPILVCPQTFMEDVVLKNGLGFSVDITDSTAKDRLFEAFMNMDRAAYKKNCAAFIAACEEDNGKFEALCEKFVGDML